MSFIGSDSVPPRHRKTGNRFVAGGLRAAVVILLLPLLLAGCRTHRESVTLYEKAMSLWDEGQFVDAARTYITVTEIYPDSPLVEDALYWAASLYHYYLNDLNLAERYYQQLLVQHPDGARQLEATERLGELYETRKESEYKAILVYRKLLLAKELAGRRDEFLLRVAKAYVAMGRLEQARFELRRLMQDYPKSKYLPQAYYLVGYSYYWEGRKPFAIIAFNQIQKDFPTDSLAAQARFFIGEIYEEAGVLRKALNVFESIRDRYSKPELLDKRIAALKARMGRSVR